MNSSAGFLRLLPRVSCLDCAIGWHRLHAFRLRQGCWRGRRRRPGQQGYCPAAADRLVVGVGRRGQENWIGVGHGWAPHHACVAR